MHSMSRRKWKKLYFVKSQNCPRTWGRSPYLKQTGVYSVSPSTFTQFTSVLVSTPGLVVTDVSRSDAVLSKVGSQTPENILLLKTPKVSTFCTLMSGHSGNPSRLCSHSSHHFCRCSIPYQDHFFWTNLIVICINFNLLIHKTQQALFWCCF